MRRLLLLLVLVATPAAADPKSDSQALYETVRRSGEVFVQLLDAAASDPADAAASIDEQVRRPVSQADTAWMSGMIDNGPDAYAPFLVCRQAAVTLESFAADFVSFLGKGGDRPDVATGVGNFRSDLTGCETALGLPATFAAGAQ